MKRMLPLSLLGWWQRLLFSVVLTAGLCVCTQASEIVEVLPLTDKILMVHYDDGYLIKHRKGQATREDHIVLSNLNENNAIQTVNYTLSSSTDGNYSGGKKPSTINRKSKGTEFADRNIWTRQEGLTDEWAKEHWVYLHLPTALQPGKTYTLNTGSLATNGSSWNFTYDVKSSRSEAVHVNNIGYDTRAGKKYGYVYHWMGDGGGLSLSAYANKNFYLVKNGSVVFTGTLTFRKSATNAETAWSNDTPNANFLGGEVYECDFSNFNTEGTYVLAVDGIGCSFPFEIKTDVYRNVFRDVLRGLYHNRSGIELKSPYTTFTRPACHNPNLTAGFENRLKYTTYRICDWPGAENADSKAGIEAGSKGLINTWGWYQDAGDWDTYTHHSLIPVYLMLTYEAAPANFSDGELNIAGHDGNVSASGNGIPDILDEARWLIRFYHRTRHAIMDAGYGTGGVGSRVCGDFWGADRPGGLGSTSYMDTQRDWYVSGEDPFSTFQYAGLAAHYALMLQKCGASDPEGINWRQEAEQAYTWAQNNIRSGDLDKTLGDFKLIQHRMYAAANLYRLTANATYQQQFRTDCITDGLNGDVQLEKASKWAGYSYMFMPSEVSYDSEVMTWLRTANRKRANFILRDFIDTRACRWGGNYWQPMNVGQGTTPMVFEGVIAYAIEKNDYAADAKIWLDNMYTTSDYFMGTNPLNMTWVTGHGERYPKEIFHMDSWYNEKGPNGAGAYPPGMIPYGPWQEENGGWSQGSWAREWANKSCYPVYVENATDNIYSINRGTAPWPGHERWFDLYTNPIGAEFTVWQNTAPAAAIYGFLCGTAPQGTNLRNPENPSNVTAGLNYAYYEGTWNNLPDFSSLTPVKTGSATTFDLGVRNRDDLFSVSFDGFVDVPTDGTYTFYTSSDDGSKLYIGTTEVVNNDGLHGTVEKSGSIGLKAGKHAIKVTFFENTGGEVLTVSWEGAGVTKQTIPAAKLFRTATSTPVSGYVVREYWNNVSGTSVSNIPLTTTPTGTQNITLLEGPVNTADNYGTRIRGYIVPSTTGTYYFYVSGDDNSEFYLSTNNDPANKAKICEVTDWTNSREWAKYTSQKSAAKSLTAGSKYYFEVLHKEGNGGDNIAVGWTGPGISAITVIPAANLDVYTVSAPVLSGLTHQWKFNNNINDEIGSNPAVLENSATYTSTAKEGAAALDLSVSTSAKASVGVLNLGSSFTVTLWAYNRGTQQHQNWLFSNADGSVPGFRFFVNSYGSTDGKISFENRGTDSQVDYSASAAGAFPHNQWNHVALVVDGSSYIIYVNGASVHTGTVKAGCDFNRALYFGAMGDGNSWNTWDGSLDNIKTYNRALSGTEVQTDRDNFTKSASIELATAAVEIGKIRVYPNPLSSNDQLTIALDGTDEALVEILNLQAQKVYVEKTSASEIRVPAGTLSKGIYLVRVISNAKPVLVRVLVK